MRANQLRLWFAPLRAHGGLRRIGLRHTQFANATCGTIRLKLLKIGAQVRRSVRRIKIAMASACPYQAEYHLAYLYLRRAAFERSGIPPPLAPRAAAARPKSRSTVDLEPRQPSRTTVSRSGGQSVGRAYPVRNPG